MAIQPKTYTADEFDAFVVRPENADKLYEYIGGRIVEVVVWRVDPAAKQISLRIPGQSPTTLSVGETLDGGDLLPGFKLALDRIFSK